MSLRELAKIVEEAVRKTVEAMNLDVKPVDSVSSI